jgi:hypothetical protein
VKRKNLGREKSTSDGNIQRDEEGKVGGGWEAFMKHMTRVSWAWAWDAGEERLSGASLQVHRTGGEVGTSTYPTNI